MIKSVSVDSLLSFAFGKYYLYNKHRERRVRCMSLVFL